MNFFTRKALILGDDGHKILRKLPKAGKSIVIQIREWSVLIGDTNFYSMVPKSLHYFGFPAC